MVAWNNIAEKMTSDFPGRVMYFPLADSVMLDGKYSAWLPPEGDPHAPSDQWLRVRKLDNVHLCPEGSARYAAALLADMTAVFRLAPAAGLVAGDVDHGPGLQRPTGRLPGRPPARLAPYEQAELLMVRCAVADDLGLVQLVPMLVTTSYQ